MSRTSGPPAVSVTLTAATGPTSSPRTSTAGSGPPPRGPCPPPTPPGPSTTGPTLGVWAYSSLTTGSKLSSTETPRPAWPSLTITTETASSGTTWPALMRSQSSARMLMVIWPTPGSNSRPSEYPETDPSFQPIAMYTTVQFLILFIYLSI